MDRAQSISKQHAMLMLIDMQTRLLPHIDGSVAVVGAAGALLEAAAVFDLPTMATVQYVKGLGPTEASLADLLNARGVEQIEKMAFSACCEEACTTFCKNLNRRQVIITGIEAHVCVMQTVLDLLAMGMQPVVCADAVSSRRALDREVALQRMGQAGAIVTTTESVLFELAEVSGTGEFKRLLEIVKRFDAARNAAGNALTGKTAGVV